MSRAASRWRGKRRSVRSLKSFEAPLWLGVESLAGKTILLHSEQGLGDTLQFCRYAPLVVQRGAKVVLASGSDHRELKDFGKAVELDVSKTWTLEATKAVLTAMISVKLANAPTA